MNHKLPGQPGLDSAGRRLAVALVGLLAWGWAIQAVGAEPSSAAAGIKIGILCTDSAGDMMAELLTTELTALQNVTVLERKELERVVREQSLASISSAPLLKAGTLLGADGLVVLEPHRLAKGISLNLRLIGVRRGVALGWWDYTVAGDQILSWPKGAAMQLEHLLPKLLATSKAAAPISFVGFTSPTSGRAAVLLEREINSLLLKRLGAQPDLLLLERQKLGEAAFEKVLSSEDRKFWDGAYLLEGTINRDRLPTDATTVVHFRLLARDGTVAAESALSGSRTNLAELSKRFVEQVRNALKSGGSIVSWDAAAEARRFYDEAQSAVRWEFWPEARAAADTALALGKDDVETRCVRLLAYTGLFRIDPRETVFAICKPRFGILEHYGPSPSPEALQAALDTAYQLQDAARDPDSLYLQPQLRAAASQALNALGWLTLRFYVGAELRYGHEEKLAELRSTMREVLNALLDAPEAKAICSAPQTISDPASSARQRRAMDLLVPVLRFGPLWQDTPEDGLALHRRLRTAPAFRALQAEADRRTSTLEWVPPLCGWKWAERQRAEQLWQTFISEKPLSPQGRPRRRGPGRAFAIGGPSLQRAFEEFSRSIEQHQVPRAEVIRSLPLLRDPTQAQRALQGLKQLREWPDSPDKQAILPLLGPYIAALSARANAAAARAAVASPSANTSRSPHSWSPLPTRRPMPATNVLEQAGGTRLQPLTVAGPLVARHFPLPGKNPSLHRVAWADGKLWMHYDILTNRQFFTETSIAQGLHSARYLAAIEPSSGSMETIEIPEKYFSFQQQSADGELAVFPDRVLLFTEQEAVTWTRADKTFSSVPSPLKSARVFQLGNRLLLYNAESIVETTSALKSFRVLASVRRRPALSPLDSLPTLGHARLFAVGAKDILILVTNQLYRLTGSEWHALPGSAASRSVEAFAGCALVHETTVNGATTLFRTLYFGPGSRDGELWWSGIGVPDGTHFRQQRLVPDRSATAPKYPFLPATEPFFQLEGRGFDGTVQLALPFHGRLLSISFPPNKHTEARVQLWPTNHSQPTVNSVVLPGRRFNGSVIPNTQLVTSGDDVFVWNPTPFGASSPGVWCIDGKQLLSESSANSNPSSQ